MAVGQNLTDWSNGVLTVKAEKQTQVNVVLADADGNTLAGAGTSIFVLKDENGAVLRQTAIRRHQKQMSLREQSIHCIIFQAQEVS